MNDTIEIPISTVDTNISIRPKKRKPIIICKNPKRAIDIMNKKYGEGVW